MLHRCKKRQIDEDDISDILSDLASVNRLLRTHDQFSSMYREFLCFLNSLPTRTYDESKTLPTRTYDESKVPSGLDSIQRTRSKNHTYPITRTIRTRQALRAFNNGRFLISLK
ncbi:hypothetical protein ACH5RR_021504 [Cinchona calisaya]|uniref:Uncharacterized protein n=1 Tax=Cinchona calisaya TaxID=153742 RepID=A0ABD2ZHH8_9GENT